MAVNIILLSPILSFGLNLPFTSTSPVQVKIEEIGTTELEIVIIEVSTHKVSIDAKLIVGISIIFKVIVS